MLKQMFRKFISITKNSMASHMIANIDYWFLRIEMNTDVIDKFLYLTEC